MGDLISRAGPLLKVSNVSNAYSGRSFGVFGKKTVKKVLNGASLEISHGEILGLRGESGCGKTTLAHCILGLLDYEGEIYIDGEKQGKNYRRPLGLGSLGFSPLGLSKRTSAKPAALQVQLVFQESGESLNPEKKIGWLLEEPLAIHKTAPAGERSEKVDQMLLNVGLDPSYKTRRPGELSGGQKQRVCIGRALLLEPKLLIADEAISALDVSVAAQILNLLQNLRESLGLGILFISHDKDAVDYLCDRSVFMKDGRLAESEKN